MDLNKLLSKELARFAKNVVDSYAPRDEMIEECQKTRSGKFPIWIPPAWRSGVKDQHSSLGKSIPITCIGVTSVNEPVYTRTPPDTDIIEASRADAVERYLQAQFEREKGLGTPGQSAWYWLNDQMNNFGGACIATLFGPHVWADQPLLTDEEGKIRKEYWRDSTGKLTEDLKEMDDVASSRAYIKAVDLYRRRGNSPIVRRYVQFNHAYPAIIGREMVAMVVKRKVAPLELGMMGYKPESAGVSDSSGINRNQTLMEVWTSHRCRLFLGEEELEHEVYGADGIVHNYGFVPFVYQSGLPAENAEGEFGVWGAPILSLISDNIRAIDTIMTARANAAYQAAYPTPVAEDTSPVDPASLLNDGGKMQHIEIRSGMVNYFPGKKIYYLNNPGLGKDFERAILEEREEIRRMIPDAILGLAESSGYNTALAIQQGRGFFGPIVQGMQLLLENQSRQELQHIDRRVPGPIYLDYAYRDNNFGAGRPKMNKVRIDSGDIKGFYVVKVEISRVVDQITLSAHMAQLQAQGLATVDEVLEARGVTDTEATKKQILVDQFRNSDMVRQKLTQDAIEEVGLADLQAEALAEQQLVPLPDGSQGVMMPDGTVAAPGLGDVTQMQQGAAGAMMGGMNLASSGPNMASTNNPRQMLPTQQQPDRFRRKGGAIPGKAQKQGWAKTAGGQ